MIIQCEIIQLCFYGDNACRERMSSNSSVWEGYPLIFIASWNQVKFDILEVASRPFSLHYVKVKSNIESIHTTHTRASRIKKIESRFRTWPIIPISNSGIVNLLRTQFNSPFTPQRKSDRFSNPDHARKTRLPVVTCPIHSTLDRVLLIHQ